MLLKIDSKNVFYRIKDRKAEYLEIFALRRTREHFSKIFSNKYEQTSISELTHCSTDLINSLDQFYLIVEDLSWYFYHTQDMPNTVEDYLNRKIMKLEKSLQTLHLYLDAELGIQGVNTDEVKEEEIPFGESLEDFSDVYKDDISQIE